MTISAQRIAVAEFCGWTMMPAGKDSFGVNYEALANRGHETILQSKLPNYPADLNATHEATQKLSKTQQDAFCLQLAKITGGLVKWNLEQMDVVAINVIDATAIQRCEALLRTIGKWEES